MLPRFFRYEPPGPPKAVVLVVHGLNLHPDRMGSICTLLQSLGVLVVRMALSGHRGDYTALEEITRESWLEDYNAASQLLGSVTAEGGPASGLPVGFLGQSLGALTFCDFLLSEPTAGPTPGRADPVGADPTGAEPALPQFSGALLLSPALSLRPKTQILRPLTALTRRLPIPSASSPNDRLYPRLPAAAYHALYRSHHELRRRLRGDELPIPATVVMHPRDELISRPGIERLIRAGHLPGGSLVLLAPNNESRGTRHLAVCEQTMGRANWRRFEGVVAEFVGVLAGESG
ncbi:MAG: hypothetical protein R6V29_08125 [Spirochaetia bacterium]